MAIEPGRRRAGVQAPGLTGGINATLPRPQSLGLEEAANAIARPLWAMAEDEARRTATDAGNATLLPRDEAGNAVYPEAPQDMGPVRAAAWRQAVDLRFLNLSAQQMGLRMDEIRTEANGDPLLFREMAMPEMQARLGAMDPRIAGQAEAVFTREYGERFRQMSVLRASQERSTTDRAVQEEQNTALQRAFNFFSMGDEERGTAELTTWRDRLQLRRAMGTDATAPETINRIEGSARLAGRVMNAVGRALEDGTLPAEELRRLQLLSSGTPVGGSVLGFDAAELAEMDPSIRTALNSRINEAVRLSTSQMAAAQHSQRIGQIYSVFERGGARLSEVQLNTSDERDLVAEWVRRTEANPQTPEGLQRAIQFFGQVPPTLVGQMFNGVRGFDAARIERAGTLYAFLEQAEVGGLRTDLTHILQPEDAAFLWHYNQARGGPGVTPDGAIAQARAALDAGLRIEPGRNQEFLRNRLGLNQTELSRQLDDGFGSYWPFAAGDRRAYAQLSPEARQAYIGEVARLHALGLPFEAAQRQGVQRFLAQWTTDDPFSTEAGFARQGGRDPWVRRSQALPAVPDPWGGSPHREYVPEAFQLFREQRMSDENLPPGVQRYQLRLGENVFLQPPPNPTQNPGYQLMYMPPGGVPMPLQAADGSPAMLYFGRVVEQQREFAAGYEVARAATQRMVNERVAAERVAEANARAAESRFGGSPSSNPQTPELDALRLSTREARETLARFDRPNIGTANDDMGLAEGQAPLRRPGPPIRIEDIDRPSGLRVGEQRPGLGNLSRDVRRRGVQTGEIPTMWRSDVDRAVTSSGVDRDLFVANISVESGWAPGARSPVGAFGLAQLMPNTAVELAQRWGGDPTRPGDNLRLGAHYLREMVDRFQGDDVLAIAAYNAGPARMAAVIAQVRENAANPGIPDETVNHVRKVFRLTSADEARREIIERARRQPRATS